MIEQHSRRANVIKSFDLEETKAMYHDPSSTTFLADDLTPSELLAL